MPCTAKKTLKTIAETRNDYVVKVKKNQPNLLKAIKKTVENSIPADFLKTEEKSRGRYEKREISVFNPSIFFIVPSGFERGRYEEKRGKWKKAFGKNWESGKWNRVLAQVP